jgi:hypothetical protein
MFPWLARARQIGGDDPIERLLKTNLAERRALF